MRKGRFFSGTLVWAAAVGCTSTVAQQDDLAVISEVTESFTFTLSPEWSTTIPLEAPPGVSAESLVNAAKALVARCDAVGYREVTARISGGRIELSRTGGWTGDMQIKVAYELSRLPMAAFDLALLHDMTAEERADFKPPHENQSDPRAWKAPPGTCWLRVGSPPRTYLVRESLRFSADELRLIPGLSEEGRLRINLTSRVVARLSDIEPKRLAGRVILYADGKTPVGFGSAYWWFDVRDPGNLKGGVEMDPLLWDTHQVYLSHPLPYSLTPCRSR